MNNPCNPQIVKKVKVISIVFTMTIVGLMIYFLLNLGSLENTLKEEVYTEGLLGLFASSLFLDLFPQFFSPFLVLATGIVAGINIHLAILFTIIGSTVGAILGYFLGKKYMFSLIYCLVNPIKINRTIHLINRYGKIIVPLTAVSPLPYFPLVIGALNFSKKNFLIYGLIPRAMGIIGFGYFIALF